jgi:hypothetical protein
MVKGNKQKHTHTHKKQKTQKNAVTEIRHSGGSQPRAPHGAQGVKPRRFWGLGGPLGGPKGPPKKKMR